MSRKLGSPRSNGAAVIRCAIYTRKSSEEGLEQEFNSLDAQREACEAYIRSQKAAGWIALQAMYDDGGISGGTMERPALQRLLADIAAGRIDTVVVYKVDRLTRSLHDFAKIVDAFDAKGVSFVSVTQQFNTTTSMGRLTLNMLLSFAQFEREVTSERIRDKIAASKQKGMWMGGNPPLGYDVLDRKLVINEPEAERVRDIFRRYAGLKSVHALKEDLDAAGILSKSSVDRFGMPRGGKPLARGALYLMLKNRIYRGEIVHKDKAYPGLHDAIVDEALWDMVQAALAENRVERVTRSTAANPSLLAGLVYDASGDRMSPTHANKKGTRYRYYISQSLIKRGRPRASGEACRVPASDLETIIDDEIIRLMRDEELIHEVAGPSSVAQRKALIMQAVAFAERWPSQSPSDRRAIASALIERVVVAPKEVALTVRLDAVPHVTAPDLDIRRLPQNLDGPTRTLSLPARIKRTGMETKLLIQGPTGPTRRNADRSLIRLLAQAHRCRRILDRASHDRTMTTLAAEAGTSATYFTRVVRLSFLAPEITKMILQGRQPPELTANLLVTQGPPPTSWEDQKRRWASPKD
ncbi:recombinase family protein [Hyphomicrobium sp. MC1]|uniref:recombinase family protein n=1 Tax=Hyphomicrobium sp. (strain MC1) TaxID=717785 RepID=UPI000213F80B|nr:recombinase family protein [Hyphomicrobium sp. MC1]CCB63359.1 putative resolvase [Hyphomicrobium sp. MC1]